MLAGRVLSPRAETFVAFVHLSAMSLVATAATRYVEPASALAPRCRRLGEGKASPSSRIKVPKPRNYFGLPTKGVSVFKNAV